MSPTAEEIASGIEDAYRSIAAAQASLMKSITDYYAFLEPHEYEHAGDEVGALLTVSPSRGSTLVDHALTLSERSRVLAALSEGRVDLGKALLIASTVQPLDAAHHEAVENDLLAFADTHHYSSLQQHARRVIHRIDPAAALARHEEKKRPAGSRSFPRTTRCANCGCASPPWRPSPCGTAWTGWPASSPAMTGP